MSKQINIGGRLHSTEQGNVITGANEVLDDTKGKKQNVINADVDVELLRLDQSKQNNLTFDNTPTENSNNPVKSSGVYAADKALSDAIEAILILIPSAATALNQLADKNFVNSSIATDTATFRGTSETGLSEAQFLEWANSLTHDMNDYVFWQTIDEAGNTLFKRYKWNGTQWLYEYTLNNSSFTADQWAAITSGITTALVEKLVGLPTNAALQQALNSKQNSLTFDNVPTENSTNPVKSGGVYSAVKAEENARLNLAHTVSEIGGDVSQIEDVIPTGATVQNKLVANASMEAYVASIIQNITASFTLSTADGHINLTLTQVNGRVATLTLTSSDIASAQALTALTGRVITNETDISNLQQLYNDLQQSKPVPVSALPETGQQQGVIYRLAGTTSYSDYMWNGSTWVLMATYNNAIDPRPKKVSQNLVTSGGVFDNMGALDVSELNATENPHTLAQYADLSAALAAIPTDYQKGGMSIKFIQSSDNKYVQYRLMSGEWSTDTEDWAVSDNGVYVENTEFVYVKTDKDGKVLYGVRADGSFYFGAGCPQQVMEKLLEFFDGKVDKEVDKSLIDAEYANGVYYIESPEYIYAVLDSNNKILFGIENDGKITQYDNLQKQITNIEKQITNIENPSVSIRIMSNNVGYWNNGTRIEDDAAALQRAIDNIINYKRLYAEFQPDFLALQNYEQNIGGESSYNVDNIIYNELLPYHYNQDYDKANKSRYEIISSYYNSYEVDVTYDGNVYHRSCKGVTTVISVGERKVSMTNTNLPATPHNADYMPAVRSALLDEIISDVETGEYDYSFIMGDFNMYGASDDGGSAGFTEGRELEAHINSLGWKGCNHAYLGPVRTVRRSNRISYALDNIIFKNNGKIQYKGFKSLLMEERQFSPDWKRVDYDPTAALYSPSETYTFGDLVNLSVADVDYSYKCNVESTNDAPLIHLLSSDHYPVIGDFYLL